MFYLSLLFFNKYYHNIPFNQFINRVTDLEQKLKAAESAKGDALKKYVA